MVEEVSDGSGSSKSWDAVEPWEPEEEGPAARLGQRLKAQVQVGCLEAQEEGCQLRFLKEGCKTLSRARKRRSLIVLELWKQTTSVSKFRLKRLGRAMGYWKFVVDNDEEKQRLIMEERLEKHERQLQRSQVLGAIAMTATVSSLCLALLCFLKDRAWKKSFRERQLQIEDELQNKEREYKIDLDKVEQRVKKSLNLEHRQSSAAVQRLAKQMAEQLKELEQRQQEASDESNRRIDLLRDFFSLLRFGKLGQRRSRL
ncbi:unnamed protein product [Cladocopium goreaui]|uniref:Uncharacterized protein n=1 Tax=Cladocopium goreaui TaxID=2562237 RepID=A0A9P1C3N4_9DINO|nr:unnamed protein product [Cladocopium goreaui]